jgi:hypothetical protein
MKVFCLNQVSSTQLIVMLGPRVRDGKRNTTQGFQFFGDWSKGQNPTSSFAILPPPSLSL